ncbi:PhoH family protein [bacterium]|nr:PhoH family protein [bacterium]
MTKKNKTKKIYVLDTSVILHDHNAIKSFKDNDTAIPITVLEELDNFKRGSDIKNYEAREFIRFIDKFSSRETLTDWVPIGGKKLGQFKIIMHDDHNHVDAEMVFNDKKNDHKILNAALCLQKMEKNKKVVLVSKDINLRLKARSLNLPAEDFEAGKVQDIKNLYTGHKTLEHIPHDKIQQIFDEGHVADVKFLNGSKMNNHYYILKNGKSSGLAYFNPFQDTLDRVEKLSTYGIKPRNAEQTFAMHAILNPDIRVVTIQGVAGTGKTLLALAGSLEQRKNYRQIILARPIVPLSNKDIGYLPGDVNDKIGPYMEPLWDNLKFIKSQFSENDKNYKLLDEMVKSEKITIIPLAYIRGRSFANVMMIVDEAQNLTPHEVKTIITRAGENTKFIFTGDINQIDTPYLDEQSNGLSYLIERLKGNKLFAHITLEKGERSELANVANELL